ncbi:HNH homing endonuclease [Enterococcus phage SSsP-1]|uniref:HNH homing endonuclease n=1 Tax=Enterococcus phage SSsP-1 TaxID=2859527 RepID=A0AAE8BF27_9CAUD|nr:HNH homing endonuclease [Enterococcus phage SSsP-1]
MELWREVSGTKGDYWVSNLGRVVSTRVRSSGKLMTGSRDKDGYLLVTLYGKSAKIHRLVAEAFIPNPEKKECVNHIDEVKSNNSLSNLEWATKRENALHGTAPEKISKRNGKSITYLDKKSGKIVKSNSMMKASVKEGKPAYYFGNLNSSKSKENELYKIL